MQSSGWGSCHWRTAHGTSWFHGTCSASGSLQSREASQARLWMFFYLSIYFLRMRELVVCNIQYLVDGEEERWLVRAGLEWLSSHCHQWLLLSFQWRTKTSPNFHHFYGNAIPILPSFSRNMNVISKNFYMDIFFMEAQHKCNIRRNTITLHHKKHLLSPLGHLIQLCNLDLLELVPNDWFFCYFEANAPGRDDKNPKPQIKCGN